MTRALDLTFSLLFLVLLSPLLILIAIAIRAESPGNVIYRQVRVGRNQEPFEILKFRTMIPNAASLGSSVTTARDPRITRVGRVLRKSKLDEIPQLWNVVKGEMSLVGPRPDVPEIVATYTQEMLHIFEVRPGITSVASLDLSNEEGLLALAPEPDDFYVDVVVPAKVMAAMKHVDDRSVGSYFGVILATGWKLILQIFGLASEGRLTAQLRTALRAGDGAASEVTGPDS